MGGMIATADFSMEWEPRRAQSLRQARRRSRLVGGLRRFFVAGAGASLASVFVFMALFAIEGGFAQGQYAAAEPLRMINPRFTGRTQQGGPYQLSAEMAERERGEGKPITLSAPVYRTEAGTIMLAPAGVYDEVGRKLSFNGEVLFSDQGGNRFSTPNMTVDLAAGILHGESGVTGAGPLGVMQADRYEMRENDRALALRGNVRGQIPDKNEDRAAAPVAH